MHAAEINLRKSLEFVESFFAYTMLAEISNIKHDYPGTVEAYTAALDFVDKDMVREGADIRKELEVVKHKAKMQKRTEAFEYPMYVPKNILPLYNKALLNLASNPDSALFYFLSCLKINDCPLVNWQVGNILMQKQDKRVLHYYIKAHSGFSRDSQFLINLIVANLVNKNKPGATIILNELVALDPDNSSIPSLKAAIK